MRQDRMARARAVTGWAALGGGMAVLAFWVVYFTSSADLGDGNPTVGHFEAAFLIADGVFALILLAAGVELLRRRPFGTFLLVAGAAMSIYLGLLDVTFYSRQGLYSPLTASAAFELLVNGLCLAGGLFGLRWAWHLWPGRTA
jgi:hypothetical protein